MTEDTQVEVKCITRYFDIEFQKEIPVGATIKVPKSRAEFLINKGKCAMREEPVNSKRAAKEKK